MVKMDILRGQHRAALAMAERLLELVHAYRPGHSGVAILIQLNRLYGILRLHLAQEDVQLYPVLIASPDPGVATIARRYADEMGGLALDLECFAQHWSCSASIVNNFDEFRDATRDLIARLAVRIEREDLQLYPLADAMVEPPRRSAC